VDSESAPVDNEPILVEIDPTDVETLVESEPTDVETD
jgi:hypothetical protein